MTSGTSENLCPDISLRRAGQSPLSACFLAVFRSWDSEWPLLCLRNPPMRRGNRPPLDDWIGLPPAADRSFNDDADSSDVVEAVTASGAPRRRTWCMSSGWWRWCRGQ
jgi:hypothetical protein